MPKPAVIGWYRAYCAAMALLYLMVITMGVAGIALRHQLADHNNPPASILFLGIVFIGLGLPFLGAFAVAPFLPTRPWVWIYHLVLIAIGMTSACCLPACVPLLIYWIRPETKAYYGRS
jgi:hypothetical protein